LPSAPPGKAKAAVPTPTVVKSRRRVIPDEFGMSILFLLEASFWHSPDLTFERC